jgi:hypothetical protein
MGKRMEVVRWWDLLESTWRILFTTAFVLVLGLTQSPIQWVQRALIPGVKRPGSEADHSPPSSVEVENASPPPPPNLS